MVARVSAPNAGFNGVTAGLAFAAGEYQGEISPWLASWLEEHGYTVAVLEPAAEAPQEPQGGAGAEPGEREPVSAPGASQEPQEAAPAASPAPVEPPRRRRGA